MRKNKVTEIFVPRYAELSVLEIWSLIKDVEELMIYFPDYSEMQTPDRDYMFSVLATTRYEELKRIVKNARKQRAKENKVPEDQFIFIQQNILAQIEEVMMQKSKHGISYHCTASKGNSHYLLRKCAKIQVHHKPSKKCKIDAVKFIKDDEANRKQEKDHTE